MGHSSHASFAIATGFGARTRLERALGWEPGSAHAVLAGHDPTPTARPTVTVTQHSVDGTDVFLAELGELPPEKQEAALDQARSIIQWWRENRA